VSWDIGSIIGSSVGKAVAEVATPFTNAWVETKKSAAATHTIDKQTDRDITLAAYQADVQLGLAQRLLAAADSTHWSTRWIRPAFAALAFVWVAAELYFWMRGVRPVIELDIIVKGLLASIIGAIFVFRPSEKGKRTDIVAAAQQGAAAKPNLLSRITTRRADAP
jgi:hypothetical protein